MRDPDHDTSPVITFTTDYGLADAFVGVCHGVIARIAPALRVLDVAHGVPGQDVVAGAVLLADAMAYLPERAVHLAVVDPGVGTSRRGVVVAAGDPQRPTLLVGPDNGLLLPAAEHLGGVVGAWALTEPRFQLEPVSRTFHGRDVFAPAAAHLALGVAPSDLGPSVGPETLVALPLPPVAVGVGVVGGGVVGVDGFGNVALALRGTDLDVAGFAAGAAVEVVAGGGPGETPLPTSGGPPAAARHAATVVATFGDLAPDALGVLVDSWGRVALAVRGGDAAARLGIDRGTHPHVEVRAASGVG